MQDYRKITVRSRAELRAWLAANHRSRESIWLVTYKKSAGELYLPYDAIVEEALCWGWIDSRTRALDAQRSMLLFSPRRPGSGWSRVNKERIARLIEQGLMMPPGLALIEQAKADGSWNALDDIEALKVPPDLAAAFRATPKAKSHFDAFGRSSQKIILLWVLSAKRPETRAKRIAETVRLAARNLKAAHPAHLAAGPRKPALRPRKAPANSAKTQPNPSRKTPAARRKRG